MRPIHFVHVVALFLLAGLTSCNEYTCENRMCENGGICEDGKCNCPEGFTGAYCQEQAAPAKVSIRTITLTRFPDNKNDMPWDASDGPDIFFRIYDGQHPVAQPLMLFENVAPGQNYTFFIPAIILSHVTSVYSIKLLDYDGRGVKEDLLGEIDFLPYSSEKGKPATVVLDEGGPIAFVMDLEYIYDKPKNKE